jgi:hypothetical protein
MSETAAEGITVFGLPADAVTDGLKAWHAAQPDPVAATVAEVHVIAAIKAAAPHIAVAERERIYDLLGHDHVVIFTEDHWSVEHSVECRLSGHMHECDYHGAVARIAAEFDPDMAGRWRIDEIDGEGLPVLSRAEETGGAR